MIRWLATVLVMAASTGAWAAPIPAPVPDASPFPFGKLFGAVPQTPHPSVVRVVVQERGGVSLGSGALVAVQGAYGLVLTNWHVVRDAAGPITVIFPDGFRSGATVLKVDSEWDLAALAIWRPQAEPIPLAGEIPRLGEPLTIMGYGSGQYRAATGRCLQYLSPGRNQPAEMIELSVAARQGDSGGPILNSQGELSGVLFGASWGRTAGSSCRRIRSFVESLAPWFEPTMPDSVLAWNQTRPAKTSPTPMPPGTPSRAAMTFVPAGNLGEARTPIVGTSPSPANVYSQQPGRSTPAGGNHPVGVFPGAGVASVPSWSSEQRSIPPASISAQYSQGTESSGPWAGSSRNASSNVGSEDLASAGPPSLPTTAFPMSSGVERASEGAGSAQSTSRFEAVKNFLAFVGAVALLLQAVKLLCAGEASQ